MRKAVPKGLMVLVIDRIILNPLWVRSSISFLQKAVDSGDRVDEWGIFPMAFWMVSRDLSGPTSTGKTIAAYSSRRDVAGWPKAQVGAATVSFCTNLM